MEKHYDESPQVFCLFTKKSETISINSVKYRVPLANIISEIALLSDSCFDKFDSGCALAETALSNGTHPQIVADLVKQITSISGNNLINALCLWLPSYSLYSSTLESLKAVDFSPCELETLQASILDSAGNFDHKKYREKIEFLNVRTGNIDAIQSENESYYQWIRILKNDVDFTKLGDDYIRMYHIPDAAHAYIQEARKMIVELKRIRNDLNHNALDVETALAFYRGLTGSVRIFDPASSQSPFDSAQTTSAVYTALSFSSLVSLELIQLHQHKKSLSRCAFCGRYYSPYNSKSKYCSYPNPLYDNEWCSKIAPHIDFINRERSTPYGKEYRKNYTSYNRWVSRNWKPHENNSLWKIRSYLNDSYDGPPQKKKQYIDQVTKQIQDEIDNNFTIWNRQAQTAQTLLSEGMIREDECQAAIQVPPVESRSPLLKKWIDAAKEAWQLT